MAPHKHPAKAIPSRRSSRVKHSHNSPPIAIAATGGAQSCSRSKTAPMKAPNTRTWYSVLRFHWIVRNWSPDAFLGYTPQALQG